MKDSYIGKTIGGFLVIEELGVYKLGWQRTSRKFDCICSCGQDKEMLLVDLKRREYKGQTSCNCNISHRSLHDHFVQEIKRITDLCRNETVEFYNVFGGRGINIKESWTSTYAAQKEIKEAIGLPPSIKHLLDRYDYERDFTPDNIFWL